MFQLLKSKVGQGSDHKYLWFGEKLWFELKKDGEYWWH